MKTFLQFLQETKPVDKPEWDTHEDWVHNNQNLHLGLTPEHVHSSLKSRYPISQAPHQEAIHNYNQSSKEINGALIHGSKSGHPLSDSHKAHVTNLDKAIDHHALTHDLHVYSGVGFHPGEEAAKNPNNHIHLPAYTSSSIDKEKASFFARDNKGDQHLLHIHLKPGQKGLYLGDKGKEREFLLPRNQTLKVHPKPERVGSSSNPYLPSNLHVWHAEIVDQGK